MLCAQPCVFLLLWAHGLGSCPSCQWVLGLPIPLRLLLAAQPKLMTPALLVAQRVITRMMKMLSRTGCSSKKGVRPAWPTLMAIASARGWLRLPQLA